MRFIREGFQYLKSFRVHPFPLFTFLVTGIQIEKCVFLVHGQNTVVIRYQVSGILEGHECALEIRPLIAFRDYHSTTHSNGAINGHVEQRPQMATVTPYGDLPSLHFGHNADALDASGFWFYNFEYECERERGLDFLEDLYSPFLLHFDLQKTPCPSIVASIDEHAAAEAKRFRDRELDRRKKIVGAAPSGDEFTRLLTIAADQFLVARAGQESVIAGYPWFGDWGRDTMISLPGLTLVTGRHDEARAILAGVRSKYRPRHACRIDFPMPGKRPSTTRWTRLCGCSTPFSNSCATRAITSSSERSCINRWRRSCPGTNAARATESRMDSDGLLRAGEPGVQLTWMDAKVGDWVVTPRMGKPVEIQALWYNALRVMERLAAGFADHPQAVHYAALADRVQSRFRELFWNEQDGCLYDVVGDSWSGPGHSSQPDFRGEPSVSGAGSRPGIAGGGGGGVGTADALWLAHAFAEAIPIIAGDSEAIRGAATAPIIRVRCGRGCWVRF